MTNVFELSNTDLQDAFVQTAFKMGIGSPNIIEKDYWLVKSLEILFSDVTFAESHVFKGGTSLSKCYQLIQRFSEDVDITISRKALGFNQKIADVATLGSKKRKRYFDELLSAAEKHVEYIKAELEKQLQQFIQSNQWKIYIDPEDKQKIIFEYPKLLISSTYPNDSYIKPKILLEFGCRGDTTHNHATTINTYIETAFEDAFQKNNISTISLRPERTLWEKITLLHMLAHQPKVKPFQIRMARHYYDTHKLIQSEISKKALMNFQLLNEVAYHKSIFFKSKQASYETAKPGSLKLIPSTPILKQVEKDYLNMGEMFFGEPIPFATIIKNLSVLENSLNENIAAAENIY